MMTGRQNQRVVMRLYLKLILIFVALTPTNGNAPPACFLACTNNIARWCPNGHINITCICSNHLSLLGCLTDVCQVDQFVPSRDHFLGTCLEHHIDIDQITNKTTLEFLENKNGYITKAANNFAHNLVDSQPNVILAPPSKAGLVAQSSSISNKPVNNQNTVGIKEDYKESPAKPLERVTFSDNQPTIVQPEQSQINQKKLPQNEPNLQIPTSSRSIPVKVIRRRKQSSRLGGAEMDINQGKKQQDATDSLKPTANDRPKGGVQYNDGQGVNIPTGSGARQLIQYDDNVWPEEELEVYPGDLDHINSSPDAIVVSNKDHKQNLAEEAVSNSFPEPPKKIYKKESPVYDSDGLQVDQYSGFVNPLSNSRARAKLYKAVRRKNNLLGGKTNEPFAANHMPMISEN